MSYPIELKEKATTLRKQGYSIKEISKILKIAQGTSSVWLSSILVTKIGQERLKQRRIFGQHKTRLILLKKQTDQNLLFQNLANKTLKNIAFSRELSKLICALLYWCEGNKDKFTVVKFTNSDPNLIIVFLRLLRDGFEIDESKFRILMHLHGYHNEQKQKFFWHKITKIPLSQFHKTYLKPNTGKRNHKDYPGCIALSYYDAKVAKELRAIYNSFMHRGVG